MPLYEFECPKGHVLDAIVPLGTTTRLCPACTAGAKSMDDLTFANRVLNRTQRRERQKS